MKKLLPLLVMPLAALALGLSACQQSSSTADGTSAGQLPADAVDLKVTGMV